MCCVSLAAHMRLGLNMVIVEQHLLIHQPWRLSGVRSRKIGADTTCTATSDQMKAEPFSIFRQPSPPSMPNLKILFCNSSRMMQVWHGHDHPTHAAAGASCASCCRRPCQPPPYPGFPQPCLPCHRCVAHLARAFPDAQFAVHTSTDSNAADSENLQLHK